MDWPALAIVFTVSSLMMILERFVNQQRQSDGRSASRCDAFDDTPAAVRRSSHFQTTRSRKKLTRPQTMTTFGGCCNFNDEQQQQQQQQQQDDICSDDDDDYTRLHHHHPNQSAVTETQPPDGATYRNSDQSIYCSGQNGNRRRANSSSGGSSQCGSPAESDTDLQPCETQSSASGVQPSGTGRRYCADDIDIVTEFCDTEAAETEAEVEPIDCEPHGSQCSSSWWRQCRRSMLTLSLLIDYVVRVLGVLFLFFLIISWFMRLVERKRKVPGDPDGYEETWRTWLKGHPFLDSIFSSVFGCEIN